MVGQRCATGVACSMSGAVRRWRNSAGWLRHNQPARIGKTRRHGLAASTRPAITENSGPLALPHREAGSGAPPSQGWSVTVWLQADTDRAPPARGACAPTNPEVLSAVGRGRGLRRPQPAQHPCPGLEGPHTPCRKQDRCYRDERQALGSRHPCGGHARRCCPPPLAGRHLCYQLRAAQQGPGGRHQGGKLRGRPLRQPEHWPVRGQQPR